MEKQRDEIIANIRGCLISVKGRVELRQLCRDYRQLMGGDIPYRDFGCQSLEAFLQGIPSLIVTRNSEGLVMVDARASDKSSHITDMVSRQKAPKKKPNKYNTKSSRYNSYSGMNLPAPHTVWRPKNVSTKWKTTYKNPPRLNAVSHNQFVNVRVPATPEKPRATPQKITRTVSLNNNNVQPKEGEVRVEGFTKQRSLIMSPPDPQVNSSHTNRSAIMAKTTSSPQLVQSPTMEALKTSALAAVDPDSHIWNSWTSSSESDTGSQQHERMFHQSGEPIVDLFSYARFKSLPEPVFKVVPRQSKPHKPLYFDCKVQVGTHSFSTYPQDFRDELTAKYSVSKMALDALVLRYGTRKRRSLLNSKEVDVLERIPPLVQKHFHGIWSWQLEDDYRDLYQEQLPLNWLELVDTIETISMQLMLGNKYVLRFCNPEDKGKGNSMQPMYDVSIPTSSVNFNPGQTLLAEVTCAASAKEVWCRQLRTTEAENFEKMLVEMEELYSRERDTGITKFVENPSKGSYYAAYIDDSWHRVQVYDVFDGEDTAQCFLVDRGDVQTVSKRNIYSLRRHFAKEGAQAFLCRLFGLEELYEVSNMSDAILNLEGSTVQLEQYVDEDFNSRDDPVNVVMYDVVTGNSINEELVDLITIENALPNLDTKSPNEVFVSNIETNGDIYIQLHSMGYEKLTSLLEDLEATLLESPSHIHPVSVTPENSVDRLYFSKSSVDGKFQRVRIIDWAPTRDMAQLYYVDTGHCPVVSLNKTLFYPLEEISNVVNRFPDQALRVQLDIERVPDNFAEIVEGMVPKDDSVIVRVVEVDDKNAHTVKMFVRVPNVGLVSVDESINAEVKKQENHIKSERKLYKVKNVPSAGNLKAPPLASIGDFFDVKVPCATNPWNFFVQPFETYEKLTKLMQQLQTRYADIQYSPLCFEDIQPGKIYASKYEDGRWYRTCVMKVIHSGSISVFYCDFGYYWSLTVQQLLPLDTEFLQLPYQAIKAKLVGIKPKQQTWSMEDCKYFQKIVVSKTLVSVLRSIEKDELYKYDTVLGLNLIDTSTEEDVYINKILIRKGIAVEAN